MSGCSVYVVVDHASRQFIGKIVDPNEEILSITSPVLMVEVANGEQVSVRFAPVVHSFEIDKIEIKWTSKYKAPNKLIDAYEDYCDQVRAVRAGIKLAKIVSPVVS